MRSSISSRRHRPGLCRNSNCLVIAVVVSALLSLVSPLYADDITIGWISRQPELDYVWDSKHPESEGWPAAGEVVTWRAHVRYWSDRAAADIRYVWRLDGALVAEGTIDLAPNTNAEIDLPLPWSFQRHLLSVSVDTTNAVLEESDLNNELAVFTDAIAVGYYVEQKLYDFMRANQYKLGIGSSCFETWAQRTISRYNDMAALAIYPETPAGVLDRWRLQKIVVVPDGALPLVPLANYGQMGGEPNQSTHPNKDDRGVDLQWGIPAALANSPADFTTVHPSNWFYASQALLHELGHARYLTDVYGWNLDLGSGTTIYITEDGTAVAGSRYLPLIDGNRRLHETDEKGLMTGQYTYIDRYSAILLNRIAGRRAVRGNYNEPENIAEYLNDLPAHNVVTIRDRSGEPVRNASVQIFRSEGESNYWYAKNFDSTPDLELQTDANGEVDMGRCPFSADGTLVHTWRRSNILAIVRAKPADGESLYGVLESRLFNLAYWRGETDIARHELIVGAANCAPLSEPKLLSPAYAGASGRFVTFEWEFFSYNPVFELWVARRGENPELLQTTTATKFSTSGLSGEVFWWVVAKVEGCQTSRSITSKFTASPRLRAARR